MAYAGLCTNDNIQPHSDAYFHASSLKQMQYYITGEGDVCAVKTPTANKPPGAAGFTAAYTIPYKTPFELTAPAATDSVGGSLITYCWEQWDLGSFGQTLVNTSVSGPLFRSYSPTTSLTRTFPNLKMLRSGSISNAGVDKASGEKLPDAARTLSFKLSVRSLHGGNGCFVLPDDSILLNVVNTGGTGFTVNSQNTAGIVLEGLSSQTVTWNVAGTNGAPVNAGFVDIYLSPDSGKTWPHHLGNFANNGSATVVLPNPDTTINAGRIKVKGTNNVFFNINGKDLKVIRNFAASISLYPVPASNKLHVESNNAGPVRAVVYNMVGKLEWEGTITTQADLPVYLWARGVYIMKLIDSENRRAIKRFVVN
jgi:hypothetical protein